MVGQVELNPCSNLVSSPFLQNNTKNIVILVTAMFQSFKKWKGTPIELYPFSLVLTLIDIQKAPDSEAIDY